MIISLVPSIVYAENNTEVERYTVLVLDTSGTQKFYRNNSLIYTADTAVSYVKQASTKFVNDVLDAKGNNKIAVVQYNSSASVVSEFSDDTTAINQKINALSSNNSNCCIAAGLEKANQLLSTITSANVDKNIVLVTTGFTNSGQSNYSGHYNSSTIGSNWENMSTKIKLYAYANVAYAIAETIKESSTIYTLGLFQTMDNIPENGKDVASFFKLTAMDLATSPSHFYEVDDPNNLEFTFDEIVDSIINPLQLDLSYDYVNIHPGIGEEEGCVEIEVWAKITNTSSKESINTLVRLKETPGLDLVENETLEHNLGNIPANESRETYWTLRATTPDGEKDYVQSVVVGSENSVAVEKNLLIKITGTLDVMNFSASDRWGFSHGTVGNYRMDSDSLEYLLSYYNKTESDRLRNQYNTLISREWGGSCHGMSIGAFLFKSNRLTPEYWDLRYDRGDSTDKNSIAENIIELYTDESRSLINYYFLTQYGPEQRNVFDATVKNGDNKNIENIVSLVKNNAILFGFNWETKYTDDVTLPDGTARKKGEKNPAGHTIILYGNAEYNDDGWEIGGTNYRNRIKAYDINCMTGFGEIHFYYDKFINFRWTLGLTRNDKLSECYFVDSKNEKFDNKKINFVTNDMSVIDYRNIENQNVEEKIEKNSMAYFTANNLTNKIRIMDKTGKYVNIDGLVTDGDLDCITYYNNMVVEDSTSLPSLNIVFDNADEYTVSNTENIENLDLNVLYDNVGINSKVSNANEITFNPQGKVDFNGENSSYELSLVANDGYHSTPWYKTTISGSNANDIKMEQIENGILVNGDNLSDVKITTTDNNEKSQVISTNKNKVLITSDLKEEPIIMIDSDDDGTYDEQLEKYTLTVNTTTGGEIVSEQVEKYSENAVVEIEAKAKSGYTFTGWTSSNGGTFEDAGNLKTKFTMPANDTTIIANFEAKTSSGHGGPSSFTVKFETNGGSRISSRNIKKGISMLPPAEPTKDGYVFDGWYKDKELTEAYDFDSKITSSMTIYAKWTETEKAQIVLTIDKKDAVVFGEKVKNDVAPKIVNDRTMLPIRFIAEALGADVEWDGDARKVTITKGETEIVITIDSDVAKVNGKKVTLDSSAFIENDRTYLPLRFVSENLGAKVEWVAKDRKVIITK